MNNNETTKNIFGGNNGPVYAGIIGIVLLVLTRYNYTINASNDHSNVSITPNPNKENSEYDSSSESKDSE